MERMKNLLIIDSDKHLNIVNEKVVRTSAVVHDLHIVCNGIDALEYLQALARQQAALPDVIVFDLQMPGLNGFDFIDQFARLEIAGKDHVELVVFTASIKPSDRQKAISKGIRHYLYKPYLLVGLKEVLSALQVKEASKIQRPTIPISRIPGLQDPRLEVQGFRG
jgi:CheY-like chemotaxis protein